MDYRYRSNSLGNSSTASGNGDHERGPELQLRRRDLFLLGPIYFLPYSLSSSYILPLCLLLHFVVAFPMRKCSGKHSCVSSTIPIAMLNGPMYFRDAKWSICRSVSRPFPSFQQAKVYTSSMCKKILYVSADSNVKKTSETRYHRE